MKLPNSFHNRISYVGTIVVIISLILLIMVFIAAFFFNIGGNYSGLLLYMALPALLILGLLLIPFGMLLKHRSNKKKNESEISSNILFDWNNKKHKNAAVIFFFGTIIFFFISSIGSYEAFHYTESNKFCGTLCHEVMEPEYATYQTSAHARVKCVECHVGAGADWYVKSKLSGLYQVYAVLANVYPKPIPTPISSLRPARETCEQCHWPEKFYPNRIRHEIHYLSDSMNTAWEIEYLMKIGPSHSSKGNSGGIHWHINSNVKIEYKESSSDREYIPWVKYINLETGDTVTYMNQDDPMDDETFVKTAARTMDCMDCHNRPSHQYLTPQDYIDDAISKGNIPVNLPQIKYITMSIFANTFENPDTAKRDIRNTILAFYKENYPDLYKNKLALIEQGIQGAIKAYFGNNFPLMGADWDHYPNHKGHVEYNGCFRCHDNNHVAENGRVISKDCNLCHTILQQGVKGSMFSAPIDSGLNFIHPIEIEDVDFNGTDQCIDCHRYLYL